MALGEYTQKLSELEKRLEGGPAIKESPSMSDLFGSPKESDSMEDLFGSDKKVTTEPKTFLEKEKTRSIGPAPKAQTLTQKALSFLGIPEEAFNKISEQAKANATIQQMAKDSNLPLHEFRQSPEFVEQAAAGFVNSFTGGIAPAVREALTGETDAPITNTEGYAGYGLGHLLGFVAGVPLGIAKGVIAPILKKLPTTVAGDPIARRILVSSIRDAVLLGPAMAIGGAGEAGQEQTFTEASKVILEKAKSGTLTGMVFGMAKGMFPKEVADKAARIIAGSVGLGAQRAIEVGGNPYTNRPVSEVIFDIGLDVFFLYNGLPSRQFNEVAKDIGDATAAKKRVKQKEQVVSQIEDGDIRRAQLKVLAVEKDQADLKAKAVAEKAAIELATKEKAKEASEKIKEAKVKTKAVVPYKQDKVVDKEIISRIKAREDFSSLSAEKVNQLIAAERETIAKEKALVKSANPLKEIKAKFREAKKVGDAEGMKTALVDIRKIKSKSEVKEAVRPSIQEKVKQPVVSKIDITPEPKGLQTVVTPTQISDIEKHFGKDIDLIPDAEIDKFLKGERVDLPSTEDITIENVTKVYQKKFGIDQKEAQEQAEYDFDVKTADAYAASTGIKVNNLKQYEEMVDYYVRTGEVITEEKADILEPSEIKEQEPEVDLPIHIGRQELDIRGEKFAELYNDPVTGSTFTVMPGDSVESAMMASRAKFDKAKLTDLDLLTGSSEPTELVSEESVFRQDKETTEVQTDNYSRAKSVATSIEEALTVDPTKPIKDAATTTWKLINDVNRWLDGDSGIDIAASRNFLSDLAVRAEEFRDHFIGPGFPESFDAWKENVSEAASWARKVEVKKDKVPGVKLYSGFDPFEAVERIKKLLQSKSVDISEYKEAREGVEKDERTKKRFEEMASSVVEHQLGSEILSRMSNEEHSTLVRIVKGMMETGQNATEFISKTKKLISEAPLESKLALSLVKPKDPGTKLYSGLPIDEIAKKLLEDAGKVADYAKKARAMKKFDIRAAAKILRTEFTQNFIDKSGNIRRELLNKLGDQGYRILQAHVLAKGAGSRAALELEQMTKEVYGGFSAKEEDVHDTLVRAHRLLDIAKYKTPKEFAFPEDFSPTELAAYTVLFKEKEGLTDEQAARIESRVQPYFDWMKKVPKILREEGLISEKEEANLVAHNYQKTRLAEIYDVKYEQKIGSRKRSVYESGIQKLARGRKTDIFEFSGKLLALESFSSAYGRIMSNRANNLLVDLAVSDKQNPFARIKIKGSKEKIPTGWVNHFYYRDGKRQSDLFLNPEFSKEWISSSSEVSYRVGQVTKYLSGAPITRTFATGVNWGFALANVPRDVMHAWFAARTFENGKWKSVYSTAAPQFALELGQDLSDVFLDAILQKGERNKYIEEGGGMEWLVHQGRLFQKGRHLGGKIDKVYDFFSYLGLTSETLTRLAIRNRVIRNKAAELGITYEQALAIPKITREATFAARDYLDFNQGGSITKVLDNGLPYLNATIQGTRGLVRSFATHGSGSGTALVSTAKLMQLAALVVGAYIAAKKLSPETMKQLQNDQVSQGNFIIPLGDSFGFEDEKGQRRYPFLKVPIDQGQSFFKKFFEAQADRWLGNEVDVDGTIDALKKLSPVGISTLPPSGAAIFGYAMNKDFYLNENIVKGDTFSYPDSKEEFDPERTPQAFIDLGEGTGLSPDRTKYAVEQLLTKDNIFTFLGGGLYDKVFGGLPKEKKEQHLAEVLARTPGIKRFIGITNPYSQHAQAIDKAEERSSLNRFKQNRRLDSLAEGHLFKGNVSRKEVNDYMLSFKDPDVYDRLNDRFEFQEATKNLPNRSYWLRMKGLPLDARAEEYVRRLDIATPEERVNFMRESNIIRNLEDDPDTKLGIFTEAFDDEVLKLRRKK